MDNSTSPLITLLRELHQRATPEPWQMHVTQHSPDNDLLALTLRNTTSELLELLETVERWYKAYLDCSAACSLCEDEAYPHEKDAEIEQAGQEYDLALDALLALARRLLSRKVGANGKEGMP